MMINLWDLTTINLNELVVMCDYCYNPFCLSCTSGQSIVWKQCHFCPACAQFIINNQNSNFEQYTNQKFVDLSIKHARLSRYQIPLSTQAQCYKESKDRNVSGEAKKAKNDEDNTSGSVPTP